MRKLLSLLFYILVIPSVFAAQTPLSKSTDQRVKTVIYHPDEVYEITTAFGVATTISFAPGEEVTGVSLGDPSVWQIVPIGHTLNLKPIGLSPDTNLTVWTTHRLYLFNLKTLEPIVENNQIKKPNSGKDLLYLLKFIYPDQALTTEFVDHTTNGFVPECINEHYSMYGDRKITPHFICDDGQFTYLQFTKYQEVPAIFYVDQNGDEHAINTRQQDSFHVITRIGSQFSLRQGKLVATLFNESPPKIYL